MALLGDSGSHNSYVSQLRRVSEVINAGAEMDIGYHTPSIAFTWAPVHVHEGGIPTWLRRDFRDRRATIESDEK